MKKAAVVLIFFCLLVVSCTTAPVAGPTAAPSATNTPPPTPTHTSAPTPTLTPTPTTPPDTPTPFPNLGVEPAHVVEGMSIWKTVEFVEIPDVEGQAALKAEIPEDFTTITLIGEPYLTRAELQIDLSKLRDIDIINMYIISFLIAAVPGDGALEAEGWVRHSLSEADQKGSIEKTFGQAKVVVQIEDGKLLHVIVLPADDL